MKQKKNTKIIEIKTKKHAFMTKDPLVISLYMENSQSILNF